MVISSCLCEVASTAASSCGGSGAHGDSASSSVTDVDMQGLSDVDGPQAVEADAVETREVERLLQRMVTLFVEPGSQTELKQALVASSFSSLFGMTDKKYVLVVYDLKQAAEANHRPSTRIPPLKETRLQTLMKAVIEARQDSKGLERPGIVEGDLFVFFDGGRANHGRKLEKIFVDDDSGEGLPKTTRVLRIEYLESAVMDRRQCMRRAVASVRSDERMHMVSLDPMRLPRVDKKHFSGTNHGSSVLNVPFAKDWEVWSTTREEKEKIYEKYIVAVGGKGSDWEEDVDEADDEQNEDDPTAVSERSKKRQRTQLDPQEKIPMFYNQPSHLLCEEILHMYSICGVIDLTAGAGSWAVSALEANIPYFGVVLTPLHMAKLNDWLISVVKHRRRQESSPLFARSLSMSLSTQGQTQNPENLPVPQTKPRSFGGQGSGRRNLPAVPRLDGAGDPSKKKGRKPKASTNKDDKNAGSVSEGASQSSSESD